MLLHLFMSFFVWLAFAQICCSYEATTSRHSANLRALLWPIREKELPDGARISYKIYISPNKFEMNTNGRFKMFVGGERPIRAMLGSQGGMGEFDTPIRGNPENLYIWAQEEKSGKIQRFVIKNPNFFKNYALDFRDGEVIEYDRVNAVLEKLQQKSLYFNVKEMLEKQIETNFKKLKNKLFDEMDEIIDEKFSKFSNGLRKSEQNLRKLKNYVIEEIREKLAHEISIFKRKKWTFRLADG